MSAATIAIIPLILAVAGGFAAWFSALHAEESGDRFFISLILTGLCVAGIGLLAYLVGVVYFDDWGFLV